MRPKYFRSKNYSKKVLAFNMQPSIPTDYKLTIIELQEKTGNSPDAKQNEIILCPNQFLNRTRDFVISHP